MRVVFVLAALVVAGALPLTIGPQLLRTGSPGAIVGFALGCVAAIGLGSLALLGALIDPGILPAIDLPMLVGRCVDAATKFRDHPSTHWPQIVAALLLLFVIGRLVYAAVGFLRNAKREFDDIVRVSRSERIAGHTVLVMPAERPVALAAGTFKRAVVVSSGLLASLGDDGQHAVLAHERAHATGWHGATLLFAQVVAKAFAFVPPIKCAMEQLLLGLEMLADDAAVRAVGDPIAVANTLVDLADGRLPSDGGVLAAAGSDVQVRVRRLLRTDDQRRERRGSAAAALVVVATVLITLTLSVGQIDALTPGRAVLAHQICHLPHTRADA